MAILYVYILTTGDANNLDTVHLDFTSNYQRYNAEFSNHNIKEF